MQQQTCYKCFTCFSEHDIGFHSKWNEMYNLNLLLNQL